MKIPKAENPVIAEDKLRNYLLNSAHPRGGSKAKLLLAMGYRAENWQRLEADIRAHHLNADIECEADTEYGRRYEIVAALPGSHGQAAVFRSIWQIAAGTDQPRLITMYPE